MADEPVIVTKTQPMKAGNGVEEKTELTISIEFDGTHKSQKPCRLRRGETYFKPVKTGTSLIEVYK